MSYELFEKAAALNAQFEKIPSKVSILARGILIDKGGNINYKSLKILNSIDNYTER